MVEVEVELYDSNYLMFFVVQVGFGILVGLDFQMYVNVHQGSVVYDFPSSW